MSTIKEQFKEIKDGYKCKTCEVVLSVQNTGTTSHLWSHLERKHVDIYKKTKAESDKKRQCSSGGSAADEPEAKKQASLTGFLRRKIEPGTKKKFDTAVLKFVVADGRPFEAAAGPGFINLCFELTLGEYIPPHPTTLSRRLANMKKEWDVKMKVKY